MRKDMTVEFLSQTKDRRLADVRHQIRREVFGHTFDYGKSDQKQGNHPPRVKARRRNETLQGKWCRSWARVPVSECLVDDRYD